MCTLHISIFGLTVPQTKNIPKPDMALPSEDSTCAICDDSEGENTNQFLYDGINQLKDVYRGFDGLNGLTRGLARETIHITSRRKPNSDGS